MDNSFTRKSSDITTGESLQQMKENTPPLTYGADKAGHVIDYAAGQVKRDVRLDGHQVKDNLSREACHVARCPRAHGKERRFTGQHLYRE